MIELRYPTDVLSELEQKMHLWIANGAQLGWLIDPTRKVVAIYRHRFPPELRENCDEVHGEGPIEGFVLPLKEIWN